jgi:aminoglycoside phosphotransferase family enzyme/predicted kinase
MAAGDQNAVIDFLSRGASYGRPDETPRRIDTHISIVFLVGDRVFKLKRAVRFSFLDFSDLGARERYCRAELALNRRTAPELYLAVRAITRKPDGGLEWDGAGEALDWVVEMQRFDERDLFDRMATEGRLTPPLMVRLADAIAQFHQEAERVDGFGGAQGIDEVIEDNHANLVAAAPPLDRRHIDDLRRAQRDALGRVRNLLDKRRADGKVRRCHGDLHLRNICLFKGEPTLFDCIEFGDAFASTDVLYDLAFLLMDLEHRGLRHLANIVFNRYLDRTDEIAGLAALPLFLAVRAAVRAKVAAASLAVHKEKAMADANAYLDLAHSLLRPGSPHLIAIGGLSGTGKSTVALGLASDFAPAPGARVIRSDVLRKTLMQVAPETRLSASAYTPAVNEQVYRRSRAEARAALGAGYTVILDATFIDPKQRNDLVEAARAANVRFTGLWLTAPAAVLEQRVKGRHGDASDADHAVLMRQLAAETGGIDWAAVDASGSPAASLAAARQALQRLTITT